MVSRLLERKIEPAKLTGWVIFGGILPDVMDKPLSMMTDSATRGLAHSAITLLGYCMVIPAFRRQMRGAMMAVAVGWFFHILFDYQELATLLWPLMGEPTVYPERGFKEKLIAFYVDVEKPSEFFTELLFHLLCLRLLLQWRRNKRTEERT